MRNASVIAATLAMALGTWSWASAGSSSSDQEPSEEPRFEVVFDNPLPEPPSESKEKCTTSCSLAKHKIPDFTARDFEKTLAAYAASPDREAGEELEKLLFYGADTVEYIKEVGTANLPAAHLEFLQRELRRDHAIVELRMVDDNEVVLVSYGPTSVPLGAKQHLAPVGKNLQAMEFNGTVMRTGVNYLWSRY
jgi:hypothetical protein